MDLLFLVTALSISNVSFIIIVDSGKLKFACIKKSCAKHIPVSLFPVLYSEYMICLMLQNIKESKEQEN